MDLGKLVGLFMGMVAIALALTLIQTHLIAAICLIQYACLIILRYESTRFQAFETSYSREISYYKILLLIVALVDVFLL